MNLRHWLKKTPRPIAVLADDKRIDVPNNHRAINDLVATIQALEPSRLTALGPGDSVIRSVVLDVEAAAPAAAPSQEMADLQFFGKLLAEAYKAPIVEQAMSFVERQERRLAAAEREIERLRAHNVRLHQQILELSVTPAAEPMADAGDGESLVGAMIAGAMQAQLGKMTAVESAGVTPIKQSNGAKK